MAQLQQIQLSRGAKAAYLHDVAGGAADEAAEAGDDAPGDDEGGEPGGGPKDAQKLVGGDLHKQQQIISAVMTITAAIATLCT